MVFSDNILKIKIYDSIASRYSQGLANVLEGLVSVPFIIRNGSDLCVKVILMTGFPMFTRLPFLARIPILQYNREES